MNKPVMKAQTSRDAYYEAAGSWAEDRLADMRSSRRIAWIVASVAVVAALFEAAALMMLMPLKTVEPYTLMVDRNTGYVQALKPVDAQTIAPDTALTQSFIAQYVIARESFDADLLQANYRKVALWSVNPARADYMASVQASNPASPLASLPRSAMIETVVKSISPLGGRAVLVRFDTIRRDPGAGAQPPRSWVAVVRYRFSTEAMQQSDRLLNPLGFQVERYRRDQEQVAPVVAPAAGLPTSAPTTVARPQSLSATPGPASAAAPAPAPVPAFTRPAGRGMPSALPPPPTYQGPPRETAPGSGGSAP